VKTNSLHEVAGAVAVDIMIVPFIRRLIFHRTR